MTLEPIVLVHFSFEKTQAIAYSTQCPGFCLKWGDNGFGQLDQFAHLLCWEGHAGSPQGVDSNEGQGGKRDELGRHHWDRCDNSVMSIRQGLEEGALGGHQLSPK